VRLEKGGAITVVVREADGSRPVAGARVAVDARLRLPAGWSQDATRNETTTDAAGRYRLEGIGRAPVTLAARARAFGRAERTDVKAGAAVELFLFPGASLGGAVRDDAGRPVAGALVRAEGDQTWNAPLPERSDARGEFQMAGVQPGEYTVVASEGGRAPGVAVALVEPDGEAAVSLTVSDGGYAVGRIVDAEGRPVPGRVWLESFDGRGLPGFARDLVAGDAKANGTFALGPLPPGSLGIAVSAPRYATRHVDAEMPARGRTADLGEIALEAGLAIRGACATGGQRHRWRGGARSGAAGTLSEGEAVSEPTAASSSGPRGRQPPTCRRRHPVRRGKRDRDEWGEPRPRAGARR
jgi:hypothetical protein